VRHAKVGKRVDRWFAQNQLPWTLDSLSYRISSRAVWALSKLSPYLVPAAEYVHQDDAGIIAQWLAQMTSLSTPGYVDTNPSSGVRICLAAERMALDISGTFFRFGGEPCTRGKAAVIERTGCQAVTHYAMAKLGLVGLACANPTGLDDVHLLHDKVAFISRSRSLPMAQRTTNVDASCEATVGSYGCSPQGRVPGHEVDILIMTTCWRAQESSWSTLKQTITRNVSRHGADACWKR
jgi:hypothetical protein